MCGDNDNKSEKVLGETMRDSERKVTEGEEREEDDNKSEKE